MFTDIVKKYGFLIIFIVIYIIGIYYYFYDKDEINNSKYIIDHELSQNNTYKYLVCDSDFQEIKLYYLKKPHECILLMSRNVIAVYINNTFYLYKYNKSGNYTYIDKFKTNLSYDEFLKNTYITNCKEMNYKYSDLSNNIDVLLSFVNSDSTYTGRFDKEIMDFLLAFKDLKKITPLIPVDKEKEYQFLP